MYGNVYITAEEVND